MSSSRAEVRWSLPSSTLPAARVLDSGAVIFPGAFDQHGCPLVVFPVETQCKLSEEISREEVSHFIRYCLRLHNRKGEEGLVSVVADLRQANLTITRFIAETLLLLEVGSRIIHSVYLVQPKKKSVQKQLGKLLTPSSKTSRRVLFRQVFLKDVFELFNYIDRSQLTCSLGGYLIYCHESWVTFIKEIDSFGLQFLSVVSRLPLCISALQSLAQLPVPADFEQLSEFCSVNEARFQRLRRDLGLDDLLKRCECLLEKLRFPENDPCFHAMAGTVLFTHTALEMLHNYNRISAAVEKVELLWQQAFSKARLQLHREAQQIQEQMIKLHREKIQPYRVQFATDAHRAESMRLEFETSIYTHTMALVRRADVIHTLAETIPLTALQPRAPWVDDLQRMKENLCSAVQRLYQTLKNVSDFHYTYNRCKNWYDLVLCKTILHEVLRTGRCEGLCESSCSPDLLTWRRGVETFLRGNPCPEVQELVKLAHLATIITDPYLQHMGKQISHRCMTLRRLLTSPGAVPLQDLQLALQWQYEYLMGNNKINSPEVDRNDGSHRDSSFVSSSLPHRHSVSQCESLYDLAKWPSVGDYYHQILTSGAPGVVSAAGKPPSLSSFDSGFDGAGSSLLDTRSRREGLPRFLGNGDSFKSKPLYAQIHEENIASVSDSEDQHEAEFSLKRDTPQASIQIVPKITSDSLNLEIKVKRSATLPKNPWLSLPIDDLESSYTVTITPNFSNQQAVVNSPSLSKNTPHTDQSNGSQEQPTQTHGLGCTSSKDTKSRVLQCQDSFEDSDLNPIDNILSSTITDEDKPSNTVEGEASLLWDTFDLHNLRQDSCERLDISLSDWVQREQQELQEVEKTLDRAAEILQEEENVLAQEVILRELLETEDLRKHWSLWDEDQHSVVTSQDLVKSGVIGLNDEVSSSPLNPQSEPSSSDSETFKRSEVCENGSDSPGLATESLAHVDGVVKQKVNQSDVLQELRDLQVLEEQIIEESLKLDALCCSDAEEILSEPAVQSHVTTRSSCRMFLGQMEKQEVENMERSLREPVKNGSSQKVVKCSVMERNSMLKLLDTQSYAAGPYSPLVQSLDPAHDRNLSVLATGESSPQKPLHTEARKSTSRPTAVCTSQAAAKQAAKEDSTLKVCLTSESLSPSSRSDPHTIVDATNYPTALDSTAQSKFDQLSHVESATLSSLSHSPSTDLPASVHPGRSPDLPVDESSSSDSKGDSRKAAEVSSSRKTNNEQAAFDPGGVLLTPVPEPRSAFCFDDKRTQNLSEKCALTAGRQGHLETVSYDNTLQIPSEFTKPPQGKSQGWHMHNNNNNKNGLVQPSLYNATSEPQENSDESSAVMLKRDSELYPNDCVFLSFKAEAAEATGRFSGHQQNDCHVYDGGGFTQAVCRSPLQMNTSTPWLDYKTPIVLDTGSGLMKAGFADQDLPTIVFPTVIGHPKYEEVMSAGVERDLYVGHDAQHMRGVLTLKYPIRNGVVRNWDEMEMIWHHAFQQLAVSPEHHPVLLTEAAMNPPENRQRMIELMFETFNVPLTFVAMQAVLALYASGRTTGVVLDSGDGLSHSVPVFDGYCLPHAVQRFSLAGADVTMQLQKLLLEQGVSMQTSAELEIVREVKEKCCCVALDYELEVRSGGSASSELQYTLPDGQLISLTTERFRAPEILFKPELIGRDHYGMHESVFKSILQSDIDLRRSFVGNIVLSGGNTLLAGLPERLQQEIRRMVPVDLMECVRVTSPRDRDFSVWCGGAALANLPVFSSAWITAHEYEEFGPQIVFRKCF